MWIKPVIRFSLCMSRGTRVSWSVKRQLSSSKKSGQFVFGFNHSFGFKKYAAQYLGSFAYRFNRRFGLKSLTLRLLVAAAQCEPHSQGSFREVAEVNLTDLIQGAFEFLIATFKGDKTAIRISAMGKNCKKHCNDKERLNCAHLLMRIESCYARHSSYRTKTQRPGSTALKESRQFESECRRT